MGTYNYNTMSYTFSAIENIISYNIIDNSELRQLLFSAIMNVDFSAIGNVDGLTVLMQPGNTQLGM